MKTFLLLFVISISPIILFSQNLDVEGQAKISVMNSAMVRSTMLVSAATIGVVRLVALLPAALASAVAVFYCSTTTVRKASLFVALRIDTLISEAI